MLCERVRQQLEMEAAVSNVGSYCMSSYLMLCERVRQQLEMEAAVSNVGSRFTDDHVNELTLRHFENLQVSTVTVLCQHFNDVRELLMCFVNCVSLCAARYYKGRAI